MAADNLMTNAKVALNFRMQRHFADAFAREGSAMKAAERAARRLHCDCAPLFWDYQPLRTRSVYPFEVIDCQNGSLYRQSAFYYTGILSQSRIFAQLEVFEMPVIDRCETADLTEFDRRLGTTSCSLTVTKDENIWKIRRAVRNLFIKAIHRSVDIMRLTTDPSAVKSDSSDSFWIHQGIREFSIGRGQWIQADVYEANSAEYGKA
jgi:hypothetical protein